MDEASFQSAVRAALAEARQQEFGETERRLYELLASVRGHDAAQERLTWYLIVALFLRAGRDFDALLTARHALKLCREAGDTRLETRCLTAATMARFGLRIDAELGADVPRLRELMNSFPKQSGNWGLHAEFSYVTYAEALQRGDLDAAERALEGLREAAPHLGAEASLARCVDLTCQARIALRDNNPRRALELLDQIRTEGLLEDHHRPEHHVLRLEALLAADDLAAARDEAAAALDVIRAVVSTVPSECIHYGKRLAAALGGPLAAIEEARQAYDLVATAIVQRMQEIDRSLAALPELLLPERTYEDDLVAYRKAFAAAHEDVMRRVSSLFDRKTATLPDGVLQTETGLISICAWCESMRNDQGEWIPIGHLLPRQGRVSVSHSICPTCSEALIE